MPRQEIGGAARDRNGLRRSRHCMLLHRRHDRARRRRNRRHRRRRRRLPQRGAAGDETLFQLASCDLNIEIVGAGLNQRVQPEEDWPQCVKFLRRFNLRFDLFQLAERINAFHAAYSTMPQSVGACYRRIGRVRGRPARAGQSDTPGEPQMRPKFEAAVF